jgi:hypothetical protein
MSLRGKAFLAMWHDIVSEAQAEFNRWHTREHMPERLGVPGFEVGRRYENPSLEMYRYFTLYDGRDLDVFQSEPYLQRLNAPTPWSIRIQPHFRNFIRGACQVVASSGSGVGGALLTARVELGESGRNAIEASATALTDEISGLDGVTGVHIGIVDAAVTLVRTRETELRESTRESVYDAAVLVEGLSRADLLPISERLEQWLTPARGVHSIDGAVYDLAYLLLNEETA